MDAIGRPRYPKTLASAAIEPRVIEVKIRVTADDVRIGDADFVPTHVGSGGQHHPAVEADLRMALRTRDIPIQNTPLPCERGAIRSDIGTFPGGGIGGEQLPLPLPMDSVGRRGAAGVPGVAIEAGVVIH